MSLPSYIVNMDEFNEILSNSLQDESAGISSYYFLDFSTFKYDCWHTDLSIRKTFQHNEKIIIYGLEIYETSYQLGNQIKISVEREKGIFDEIESFYIYEGFDGVVFNPPLILNKNTNIHIDYYNNSGNKKQVSILIKYLLRKD